MVVTLACEQETVVLDVVKNVTPVTTKDLGMLETSSGTVAIDKGRTGNSISLNGTQCTNGYSNMEKLDTFTNREVVLNGMDDTNHNGQYIIELLRFHAGAGYPTNMYDFDIDLHRVRD